MRWGATRVVLLLGPWAVKWPNPATWRSFLQGLLANDQETRFAFADLGWPLCPVLWALPGGAVLVQRRARPLTEAEFAALPREAWTDLQDLVEWKRDSFGVLDGQVVAVDYG
ncbi:hypothetical protein [Deinococcus multiflagellatus]|uniref:Uncharacterized protein n=1 Tax=Deinococcus multiflagellatus TaxID=1656887 RepID=A0ABW1ZTQ1_9DEIO|nr:hypothetical protein [Deinococcus multiflagellatus]MBZ9715514.1 hypothetical protein [Deinococcus multiflagellatus]